MFLAIFLMVCLDLFFKFLVNIVKRVFPEFQFTWLVEETKKNLPLELDFLNEGKNSEKLQKKFSKLKFLKVF